MRLLYTLLLALVSPLFLCSLYKKQEGKPTFGSRWKEHWGITPKIKACKPIWIHAVSVGESIAATPVIKALKQANPQQDILVTTTTATGAEQISKLGALVEHRYMPLDFSWCVRHFLKVVQPSQLLIVETELWPNTLKTVHQHKIPVTVINARLSERSCLRYQKLPAFFNLIRPYIDKILCQYSSDAERFIRLGFSSEQVQVTGSVKFDIEISQSVKDAGTELKQLLGINRPIWIAASTHEGEDAIVLQAHQQLLATFPDALLILVPRHPERFNAVFELCVKQGFSTCRRTISSQLDGQCQVYLADTMGEMLTLLAAADICFMGGSLLGNKVGGHNVLEPAALGIPVINGPSYYNFNAIVTKFIELGCLTIIQDAQELAQTIVMLLNQPEKRNFYSQIALSEMKKNQGSINAILHVLQSQ